MRAILGAAFICLLAVAAQANDDVTDSPDTGASTNQAATDQIVAAGENTDSDQATPEAQSAPENQENQSGPANQAAAENNAGTNEKGVYRLGEVVVIGNPDVGAAGQTVTTINQQTIEDKAARTLDEALQQLPGIDIRLRKEGVPRLDIRGLPPRHVPLFLNGVPVNAASDGQFDPSLIPVENIAEIQVFRGTSSVLYGPGALGGVVDIVTKKGSAQPSAGLSAETGQHAERLVKGSGSGAAGQFDGFISGSHFGADGYPVADDGLRDNSDKTRTNVFVNGGYTPNDQWSFGANFGYLKGSQGIPPSTINDSKNVFATTPKFERLDDIEGRSGEFDARYAPTGSLDFRMTGYVNQLNQEDNIYDNANYGTMSDPTVKTQHVHNDDTVTGGQLQSNFDFGEAGIATVGFLAKDETSNNTGQIRDVPAAKKTFMFRNLDNDDSIQTFSAALQYVVSPLPRTHVVLGVAHHWFKQPGQSMKNDDQAMGSASYDIFDDLRFNVATSRDVRFPSVQELFDPSQGNPNLSSEKAVNYQAGFDWTLPDRSHVELTGFRNRVNGFIQNDKTTSHFANNNALFKGAEIAYRAVVLETLAFRTAYSFLEATATQSNGFDGRLDLRPKHKVDFQAIYDFAPEWQAYMDMTYLGGQVVSSRTLPVQQESLRNYAIVDAKISRSFLHDSLAVYVGVSNLLDQQSDIGPGFPLEGRFVYGGIRTRI